MDRKSLKSLVQELTNSSFLKIFCKSALIASITFASSGFVLVNGPREARLDATYNSPIVEFTWNGKLPKFTDVAGFLNGAWVGLSDEDIMTNLIQYSFSVWNNIPGAYVSLALSGIDPTIEPDTGDGIHLINVDTMESATSAAFARPYSDGSTIVDCDITIGDQKQSLASLALTLTHEVGHCLGLGHPHTSYKSIMSYSNPNRELKLSADDMAGIIYLYPDPDFAADDVVPLACGGIGTSFTPSTSMIVLLVLLLGIPLLLRSFGLIFFSKKFGYLHAKVCVRTRRQERERTKRRYN